MGEVSQPTVEEVVGDSGLLNDLIDVLPFELHVPGYHFCGPGTKLAERLERGEIGINALDEACREHDLAYCKKNNRNRADGVLAEKAFSRMLNADAPSDERVAALMTACCMVSKITFDKILSRIKKGFTGKKKKLKKQNGKAKKGEKKTRKSVS